VRLENFTSIARVLSHSFVSNSIINAFASLVVINGDIIPILFSNLLAFSQACSEKICAQRPCPTRFTAQTRNTGLDWSFSPHCHSRAIINNLRAYRSTNPTTANDHPYQNPFSHNAVLPDTRACIRPRSGDYPIENLIREGQCRLR
jgi:hypothetical protein